MKKVLSLFMLLCTVFTGAWAELVDGSTIVLQSNYLTNDWLTIPANSGTSVKAAATESNIVFQLVSAQEGGFYLQEVLSGKYVGKTNGTSEVPSTADVSTAGRYTFNLRSGNNIYAVTCQNPSGNASHGSLHHSGANVTAWEGASTNAQGSWWNVTEVEPVFKIQNATTKENRGYLAAWTSYTNGPSLADCNYPNLQSNHPLSTDDGVNTLFYMLRVGEKLCMFSLADAHGTTPKFLNASTSPTKWSETPYLLTIVRNTQTGSGWTYTVQTNNSGSITLNYNMIARADATNTVVSAACGTASSSGSVKTDTNTGDGGVPFRFYVQKDFAPTANQTTMINTAKAFFAGPDWDGLAAIVTEAGSYTIGTGYGEYTDGSGFGFALNQAQTMLNNHENNPSLETTKELVDEAINDLRTAINGLTLNMPLAGTFLRLRSVNGNHYVTSNTAEYSDHGVVLQSTIGTEATKECIFYYNDGKLLSYAAGNYLKKNSSNFASLAEVGVTGDNVAFTASQSKGKYNVALGGRALFVYNDGTRTDVDAAGAGADGQDGYRFTLEEVTELPVSLSAIDGHCYGTLYTPVNLSLISPNYGVNFGLIKAYAVEVSDDRAVMANVGDVIPANTAVVLYSNSESATSTSMYVNGQGNITYDGESNALAGVLATTNTIPDGGVMTMQNYSESGIGFYSFTGTTLKGFKAYLPKRPGVKAFSFNFEEEQTTAIVNAIAAQNTGTAYDLTGRQVRANAKGISIENGKKVIR